MTQSGISNLLARFGIRVDRAATPLIHDDGDERCLRFNNGVVQSSMRISDPASLTLGYTRAMMAFLLFRPEPRHVLVVGLGGGSLPKFIYHTLPETRVTALEIDPAVIALRESFAIPPDSERFSVIEADGGEYLSHDSTQTDVILLDAYDTIGLPEALCSESFYSHCRRALGARGVLTANLWGGEPKRALYLDRLRRVFDNRVWWCRPPHSSSLVVFAAGEDLPVPHWLQLAATARSLDKKLGLEFSAILDDLRDHPSPDS